MWRFVVKDRVQISTKVEYTVANLSLGERASLYKLTVFIWNNELCLVVWRIKLWWSLGSGRVVIIIWKILHEVFS